MRISYIYSREIRVSLIALSAKTFSFLANIVLILKDEMFKIDFKTVSHLQHEIMLEKSVQNHIITCITNIRSLAPTIHYIDRAVALKSWLLYRQPNIKNWPNIFYNVIKKIGLITHLNLHNLSSQKLVSFFKKKAAASLLRSLIPFSIKPTLPS